MLRMVNSIRPYDWGSTTEIPRLTGVENPTGQPMAELWMGAHPGAPSAVRLEGESQSLPDYLSRDVERALGPGVVRRFDGRLPFLLKILAAGRPLSIQAHPDLEQARAGFARENEAGIPLDAFERSYRDDNHKPELIRAVTRFSALRGFRPLAAIAEEFSGREFSDAGPSGPASAGGAPRARHGGMSELAAAVSRLRAEPGESSLRRFFSALMSTDETELAEAALLRARNAGARTRYEWVRRLGDEYGADRGIAAPLYLNCLELEPGEAMFLPAGTLHAYLEGVGIEVMANSDNVLRGGLTRKHVDVPELTRTLVFAPDEPEILRADPDTPPGRWHRYATPASEFALEETRVDGMTERPRPAAAPEVVLALEGSVRLRERAGEGVELARGESAFVTADAGTYSLEGSARVFVATVPLESAPGVEPASRRGAAPAADASPEADATPGARR
ncbi:MAG: mannose-6-phosphate isomerase, class I [Spirochaetes bacterium]|nr:mannose-6-phosphate isomerase, class I [Spirochaetota bacterium]